MTRDLKQKALELRRQHILEAAARVFGERGFRGATVHDVAEAAGVADGTIYNVFANKADLLLSLLDPLAAQTTGTPLAQPASADTGALLEGLFRDRWNAFTPEMLAILRVVLSEALIDPEVRAAFLERIIEPALQPLERRMGAMTKIGEIIPHDPKLISRTLTATFLGLLLLRLLGERRLDRPDTVTMDKIATILAEGLVLRTQGAEL
jgi:AcrR family transcriptional regulator